MQYIGDDDLDLFFDFLKQNKHPMKPCSTDEIESLIQSTEGKYLPKEYLKFMRYAGNGIRFFKGSDHTVNDLPGLKEGAIELLQENESEEELTDNSFVFYMHQGYQFYFFNLDEGDNPPVYFYHECENEDRFVKKYESFSAFLIDYYNKAERLIKD